MDAEYTTVIELIKPAKGKGGDCYTGGLFDKLYVPQIMSRSQQGQARQRFRLTLTVVPNDDPAEE